MNQRMQILKYTIPAISLLLILLVVSGCSSKIDLEKQVSGKWQLAQGAGTIDINLASDPKTLIIDGQMYQAIVEGIDRGSHTVKIKVETGAGMTDVWSIRQVWDDNGSTFKLAFKHNGKTETLVSPSQS